MVFDASIDILRMTTMHTNSKWMLGMFTKEIHCWQKNHWKKKDRGKMTRALDFFKGFFGSTERYRKTLWFSALKRETYKTTEETWMERGLQKTQKVKKNTVISTSIAGIFLLFVSLYFC